MKNLETHQSDADFQTFRQKFKVQRCKLSETSDLPNLELAKLKV